MTALTAISLFTGIGGLDLAARAAGFRIVAHVEINPYRRWILNSHKEYWPDAQTFTDIKTFGKAVFPSGAACDLVFGGFPCQDVSHAGDRAGLGEGTRSGLWSEFARVIGEFRPRCVFVENVAGLRSLGGTTVLADLAKLGYVGQWGAISAADVGASHRRERVFILAYRQQYRCDSAGAATGTRRDDPQRDNPLRESGQRGAELCAVVSGGAIGQHGGDVGYSSQTNGKERHLAAVAEGAQPGQFVRTNSRSDVEYPAQTTGAPSDHAASVDEVGERVSGNADRHRPRTRISAQLRSERGMGGNANGLSARLDAWQGFAAPIGHPQYDYEPPRVVDRDSQIFLGNRLGALGDGVVPAQAFPILYHLRERLCAEREVTSAACAVGR